MSNYILSTSSLTKCFGMLRAVDDVSMNFENKLITLIIGSNGSGKTTLINCIAGIYKPDSGKVFYNGEDITGKPQHEIVKKGLVRTFQIPMPFLGLTVLENLLVSYHDNPGENALWSIFKGRWLKNETEAVENAFETLALLNLDDMWNRPAYELSGGQLKLLEIGRALMTNAKTILMDEPVGSVNPLLAHRTFEHIVELKNRLGLTFVVIEHRLDIAVKYAEYVYAMDAGKVISQGNPEEVLNDPKVIKSYLR